MKRRKPTSNSTIENVYIRQEAKELARKHRWTLIGMLAIYYAISYGISMGGELLLTGGATQVAVAPNGTLALQHNYAYTFGNFILQLISILVSSGLMLGLACSTIDIARDTAHVRARDVFCRMSSCFKACRLSLWVGLKVCLWALPVCAVMIVLAFAAAAIPDSDLSVSLMTVLPFVLVIFMCALMIPAVCRYAMSNYVLAEAPETGVRACVERSKAMMKGRKWQFFKLPIPFYLALLGLFIALMLVLSLLVALDTSLLTAIIFTILLYGGAFALLCIFMPRIVLCTALFYVKHAADPVIADAEVTAKAIEAPAASTETADTADEATEPAPDAE